jgi:hypothetical protein
MPSTYSPDLRIELIANGEKTGTWGTITNDNLGVIIEDAISAVASVNTLTANQALTALNGAADQARCSTVYLTTSTTANFAVYVPPVTKLYVIQNASSYTATVYASTVLGNTTAAGTGAAVPAGKSMLVRCNGTNVFDQFNHVINNMSFGGNVSTAGNLSVTGTTTLLDDLIVSGSSGVAGQALLSQGSGQPPQWGAAFVTGMIMMWSGTIATIPSGWLLCNGSSGTPDLRNRFIIGAHSDDAGVAKTTITGSPTQTGGAKDAVLVSHTHTATVTDPGHKHQQYSIYSFSGGGFGANWVIEGPLTWPNGQSTFLSSNMQNATTGVSVANSTEGVSGTNANLPPYYALAYIMKA